MNKVKFDSIPLLDWGNNITMKGFLAEGNNNDHYVVLLPMEKMEGPVSIVSPTQEEWYLLQNQMDVCNVEGEDKKLLRKGQRVLDQKICWEVYRRDKYRCRYCSIDNVPLTVDHIITWESGGATHVNNLLTSCRKCNKKRGNLDYGSWMQHSYYLEKSKFLTEETKRRNEEIVYLLNSLPLRSRDRSR